MKISENFPPNYDLIKTVFPKTEEYKPIFCYGNTIHNPFKIEITRDLELHESVHSKQQGNDPDSWYVKYLSDSTFRLQQEIEAYGTQYAFLKKNLQRKWSDYAKETMAQALSGEMYGNLVSYGEAESKIRNFAKTIEV